MSTGQNFIEDVQTGRIRFTQTGRRRYAAQLALNGYSIDRIQTRAQFEAAQEAMLEQDLLEIEALFEPASTLEEIMATFEWTE